MAGTLSRRDFLKKFLAWLGIGAAGSLGLQHLTACSLTNQAPSPIPTSTLLDAPTATLARVPTSTPWLLQEAMFYQTLREDAVQCQMCFRSCYVQEGQLGFCRNKKNEGGQYHSLVYGRPAALQIDPIEKEPAFHVLPGATIFCTGTAGCNQRCMFCHNWELSQRTVWEVLCLDAYPAQVVEMAVQAGCDAVSFTYNEPTVFYEQMYDTAALAKERGLRALFHSNGTMNPEPLFALLEFMDAVTIDLKAFTDEFYQRISSSELWPVLRTLENVRNAGKHLEVVNLVIPTKNDNPEDIRLMCAWIMQNLGDQVPLHFLRFHPAYRFQRLPSTPVETLEMAAQIADEEGLQYVYIGNCPGHERNSTYCPQCGEMIVERVHFFVLSLDVQNGKCRYCGHEIPGIWWNV